MNNINNKKYKYKLVLLSGVSLFLNACMSNYSIKTAPTPQTVDGRVGSPLIGSQNTINQNNNNQVNQEAKVILDYFPNQKQNNPEYINNQNNQNTRDFKDYKNTKNSKQAGIITTVESVRLISENQYLDYLNQNNLNNNQNMNNLDKPMDYREPIGLTNEQIANIENQIAQRHQRIQDAANYQRHEKELFNCDNGLELIVHHQSPQKLVLSSPNAKQNNVVLKLVSDERFVSKTGLFKRATEWRQNKHLARLIFTYTDDKVYDTLCNFKRAM